MCTDRAASKQDHERVHPSLVQLCDLTGFIWESQPYCKWDREWAVLPCDLSGAKTWDGYVERVLAILGTLGVRWKLNVSFEGPNFERRHLTDAVPKEIQGACHRLGELLHNQ